MLLSLSLSLLALVPLAQAHVLHEWATIQYQWPSPELEQEAIRSGEFVPESIRLGEVRQFDDWLFVGTPRPHGVKGVPATLSTVDMVDGKPVLAPFPSWEASDLNVVGFDADHKGRLWVLSRTEKEDQLLIFVISSGELLRTVPLPRRVASVSVDDHSRSYTSIRDTDAATAFMLAASPESGNTGEVLVYTHNHLGNRVKGLSLPHYFDQAEEGSKSEAKMMITVHQDSCYLSSPKQLYSLRGDEVKNSSPTDINMYAVAQGHAESEFQGLLYHPVARALLFARAKDSAVYKMAPFSAWSNPYEAGMVKISSDGDGVLAVVTGMGIDWKYDVLVGSQNNKFESGEVNYRISVIPTMDLMRNEQRAEKEAMDYSDL